MTASNDIKTMLAAAAREHYYGDMKFHTLHVIASAVGFQNVEITWAFDGIIFSATSILGGKRIEFKASGEDHY